MVLTQEAWNQRSEGLIHLMCAKANGDSKALIMSILLTVVHATGFVYLVVENLFGAGIIAI